MLIKLNLIGMKINRSNQNEYDDPILRRLKENENNENEKRILPSIINIEKENIIEIIPSFDENQTQFNVFDKEGNDLVYMVADNYDSFVEKIKKVFNLEIIDLENV
jgi:hypothetical protein